MTLLKIITFSNVIFTFFVLFHLFLFNINVAEWGDSYRILRASEFIRLGLYPENEKRPPLFSATLALRPGNLDAIFFGRLVMLAFSVLAFLIFGKFVRRFIKDEKFVNLALILFALNPAYLYWSIRIMADVPFSFIVLCGFYLLTAWKEKLNIKEAVALGVISAIAILTRFEGYLFAFAIGVAILCKKRFVSALTYGLASFVLLLPYWLYRNPLSSSYFGETSRRVYDTKMVWVYLVSLLFLFGFVPAFFFIFKNYKSLWLFLKENVGIATFMILELLLILVWPAAIPRLFIPIIPFLVLFISMSIWSYFSVKKKSSMFDLAVMAFLLGFYVASQYFLKQQFLIVIRPVFVFIIFLQALLIVAIFLKRFQVVVALMVLSMLVWSLVTVYIHKDVYKNTLYAVEAVQNLASVVVHNDVNSVVDWYFKGKDFYCSINDRKETITFCLDKYKPDFVVISNDHDFRFEFNPGKDLRLKEYKSYVYKINGRDFYSKIFKVNY